MGQSSKQSSRNSKRHVQITGFPAPEPSPQQHFIIRFIKNFGISRRRWGMIILVTFLILYVFGYSHVLPEDNNQGDLPSVEAFRVVATPTKPYLLVPSIESNGNKLPGAILNEGSKFDEDPGIRKRKQYNHNALPGAIGNDGAFDENETSFFVPNATTSKEADKGKMKDTSVKKSKKKEDSNLSSSTTTDISYLAKEGSGAAKKKRKKRRRKRKKKKEKKKEKKIVEQTKSTPRAPGTEAPSSASVPTSERSTRETSKSESSTSGKSEETKTAATLEESTSSVDGVSSNLPEKEGDTPSSKQDGPLYDGPHPMNREMAELQVPDDGKALDKEAVKGHYLKLVQAYLAPFASGILRKRFFEVLRRRTYSLSPPGSNKGIQTLLFQLIDKKVYLLDPYEVAKNSKPFYKTRIEELIWLLSEVAKSGETPDTEFLVAIHDCVQTVNRDHEYRGAVYKESHPTFTIVSCNFSDNIPFPMWEGDPVRGGLKSWDEKMEKYRSADTTPWEKKEAKAVFRGGNRPSMYFKKKKDADDNCDNVGRTRLAYLGESHKELFDVGVAGNCGDKTRDMIHLSEAGHHAFKYILYAEGNCFWADRLNKQVFGPSAVIKQETPCGQFWEPLLRPMTHYIPTDFFFLNTVDQITWAQQNDDKVQEIVKKANEFAAGFLSLGGIKTYAEVLLTEYTKLLHSKTIKPEKGSVDVTV